MFRVIRALTDFKVWDRCKPHICFDGLVQFLCVYFRPFSIHHDGDWVPTGHNVKGTMWGHLAGFNNRHGLETSKTLQGTMEPPTFQNFQFTQPNPPFCGVLRCGPPLIFRDQALPFIIVQFPYTVYDSLVPLLSAMTHVEPSNIHALLCKSLQHFWAAAARTNGADNFCAPGAPEACISPIIQAFGSDERTLPLQLAPHNSRII